MGLPFRQLRKLWLLYLFLLFFAFFMFALSINVYLQSLQATDLRKRAAATSRPRSTTSLVVAHYVGAGNIFGNITKDDYNINDFKPIEDEGALGRPVLIPPKDSFKMQRMFKLNSFNIMASDRIPLNRTLKDYRMQECQAINYNIKELPTTSVIIVFHNEAWSVLLRTVWSVINRSPESLLKEIILIDDASEREYLQKPLEEYVATLPVRTKLFRLGVRQGLVPARMLGASNADGDVLTFLDAHCECSPGWLEPLLARIKEKRNTVLCPVIDIISDDTFAYTKTLEHHRGGFNWMLSFRWFASVLKTGDEAAKPIPTPAMAGGLFAIDKGYFFDMGAYDENMKIWGGENVEMSFRIWQCGGSIEISPCSHVGHVFRSSTPYTFPGGISQVLSNNLARAASVWMDEWAEFFFMYTAVDEMLNTKLNISDRVELRKRLKCKSFAWYLENIWPEHYFPTDDRFFGQIVWLDGESKFSKSYEHALAKVPGRMVHKGLPGIFFKLEKTKATAEDLEEKNSCLCKLNNPDGSHGPAAGSMSPLYAGTCDPDSQLQDKFVIKPNGQIMTNENLCIDCNAHHKKSKNPKGRHESNVQLYVCIDHPRQHWTYDIFTKSIIHQESKLCLTRRSEQPELVSAEKCVPHERSQMWAIVPLPWNRAQANKNSF